MGWLRTFVELLRRADRELANLNASKEAALIERKKTVRQKELETHRCENESCGAVFRAVMPHARFCSRTCYAQVKYRKAEKKDFICVECSKGFQSVQRVAHVCSDKCKRDLTGRKVAEWWRTNPHPTKKYASPADRYRHYGYRRRAAIKDQYSEIFSSEQIFERDGWICQLCSEEIDRSLSWPHPMSVSLDHRVPVALGGAHHPDNVQCAHLRCNSSKGARLRWDHNGPTYQPSAP